MFANHITAYVIIQSRYMQTNIKSANIWFIVLYISYLIVKRKAVCIVFFDIDINLNVDLES